MPEPVSLSWSVAARDTPDALDRYRHVMDDLFQVSDVRPDPGRGFANRTDVTLFSSGAVGRGFSNGQTLSRSAADIRRSGIDAIGITLQSGAVVGDCDGRSVDAGPGTIHFRDFARPSATRAQAIDIVSLLIPREAVPAWFRDGDHHGRVLDGRGGSARMLAGHLALLAQTAVSLDDREGGLAIDAAFLLIQSAIGIPVRTDAAGIASVMATIHRRATRVIDRDLLDPRLDVTHVTKAIGVSRSALYRAFEATGGVAAHIQRRRLQRAYQALAIRDATGETVASIAECLNFASYSHFSRQFRTRFGHAPSDVPCASAYAVSAATDARAPMRHDAMAAWLRRA